VEAVSDVIDCEEAQLEEYGGLTELQVDRVMEIARDALPAYGTVQQKKNGYTYLSLDDAWVHKLYEQIASDGIRKPAYFRSHEAPGAHISIIHESEAEKLGCKVKEIGQIHMFEVTNFAVVRSRFKEFFVLQVKAPTLEKMREGYSLRPLLQNHEFHITIGNRQIKPHKPSRAIWNGGMPAQTAHRLRLAAPGP